MGPEEQPTIITSPPGAGRRAHSGDWLAPSVEEMQAMLPQYEVIDILGRGGVGAVYKARQKSLKRLVAIKILPLGMADDEMKFVERFQNEAQTMAAMNHPAIVSVFDFGETAGGLLYFIMEFVDGTDVQKMIQASGKLSGEYALAITAHVCDALSYAHKRGVIHRDIKPANILIDQEGHIKVADFGLAKMDDPAQTSGLTKTNMAMGTPDYVAPEVLVTGMVADHRADLYAVGVMLYQMLTGEVPRGMFKLPSQKGIGADPRFDEIICKAMEQDREERYQSAMDVRHALDVILTTPQPKDDGTGIVSVGQRPQKPAANQPRPPSDADTPVRSSEPPQRGGGIQGAGKSARNTPTKTLKKSSATSTWLSVAGIVAVLAVGGWFAVGDKRPSAASSSVASADAKPVDDAFFAQVAAAPPDQQAKLVVAKIEALNEGSVQPPTVTITKGVVTGLELGRNGGPSESFSHFSPIAALRGLQQLRLGGFNPNDLSFLRGLKIENLTILGGSFSADVLRDLPLTYLTLRGVSTDFSALKGKPLKTLDLSDCRVADLTFVEGMPLTSLLVSRSGITDLSPIRGLPLTQIVCDYVPERDTEILRSIPTLERINEKPIAEFWASVGEVGKPAPSDAQPAVPGGQIKVADVTVDPTAMPSITNWQDVTPSVREKARAIPSLVVEADGVRHLGGASPSIPLTAEDRRDCAMRLRFKGDGQAGMRGTKAGYIFVLCQGTQTIFKRFDRNPDLSGTSVFIRPTVEHPAGFDPTQLHELLVTMQGTTIRAWLDGRFVGDAQDATFKQGAMEVAFTKFSNVQKVEVATLAGSPDSGSEAKWQPIFTKPEDFGGDTKDVEFRDGATFLKVRTFRAPADSAIVGIRSTLRYLEGDRTGSLTIRSTESVPYGEEDFAITAFISPKGANLVIKMRDRSAGVSELGRHDFPISPALKEGELFTFELRAEGKRITAIINGREVGSVNDAWTGAPRRFGITPSVTEMTEFRDVAVMKSGG